MKRILQNFTNGQTELAEIPCPRVQPGHLLIRTTRSLVSAGTAPRRRRALPTKLPPW